MSEAKIINISESSEATNDESKLLRDEIKSLRDALFTSEQTKLESENARIANEEKVKAAEKKTKAMHTEMKHHFEQEIQIEKSARELLKNELQTERQNLERLRRQNDVIPVLVKQIQQCDLKLQEMEKRLHQEEQLHLDEEALIKKKYELLTTEYKILSQRILPLEAQLSSRIVKGAYLLNHQLGYLKKRIGQLKIIANLRNTIRGSND